MKQQWVAALCTLLAVGIWTTKPATGQSIQVGVVGGAARGTFVGDSVEGAQSRTTPLFGVQLVVQRGASPVGLDRVRKVNGG